MNRAEFALDAELLAAFAKQEGIPPDAAHPRIEALLNKVKRQVVATKYAALIDSMYVS